MHISLVTVELMSVSFNISAPNMVHIYDVK